MGKHHRHHSSSSSRSRKEKKKKHHIKKEENVKQEKQVKQEDVAKPEIIKEKPCFEASGILAKYAENAVGNGKVLKFTIPFDGKVPVVNWQLFPFKGHEALPSIPLKGKSAFLVGKDQEIADIYLENQTVSKQHSVIQFREIKKVTNSGEVFSYIKPYIMDLESTNGTFLNDLKIEAAKYYEMLDQDVLRFGKSEREYVLIKS